MAYLRKPLSTWIRPSTRAGLQAGARLSYQTVSRNSMRVWCLGLARLQPLAHRAQPAQVGQALLDASNRGRGGAAVRDGGRQRRAHRVGQRLLDLGTGARQWPPRHAGQRQRAPAAARRQPGSCLEAGLSRRPRHASGTTLTAAASRRPCTSTVPSFRPTVGQHHAQAARRSVPSRRTSRRGARRGRRAARRHQRPQLVVQRSAAARTSALRSIADRADHHANGAMRAGQMMPRSSWFCSMAAPRMRVTPMP
jgi:hypothetical protein